MMLKFTKMQGLGNDFVVIDAISQRVSLSESQIRMISDRHFGIGCDQLLLVEKPINANADFRYRIFNSDGGEVAQCGNGARCFARFVCAKNLTDKSEIIVDTDAGQLVLYLDQTELVTVNMGVPRHLPAQIPLLMVDEVKTYQLTIDDQLIEFSAVSMGNPHAVLVVEDVANAPVAELGAKIESHALFPERVNVGFMQVISRTQIRLRVYERGAAETLACGSGACAAVVSGIELGLLDSMVQVGLLGGELTITWLGRGTSVSMKGPAEIVFEGQIEL